MACFTRYWNLYLWNFFPFNTSAQLSKLYSRSYFGIMNSTFYLMTVLCLLTCFKGVYGVHMYYSSWWLAELTYSILHRNQSHSHFALCYSSIWQFWVTKHQPGLSLRQCLLFVQYHLALRTMTHKRRNIRWRNQWLNWLPSCR